jgi:peptidyl-prolyl cis-trans isomerase B (cyclophilin B)
MKGIIKTNKGDMHVDFFEKDAPNAVANMVKLAKEGYYDGLKWHRVLDNFVIQGGCPNSKDGASGMAGTGGPGYQIDCELDGENQYHDRGVLSMAHSGRNTGGSQFFVCHSRDNTAHLDGNHTCFGKVTEGLDVIDQIREGDSIDTIEIID